jgi:prepilin-type N-terminal cleavage/methylation domain-containing protein
MNTKKSGYSLLEILIAITLAAIVITAAVRSVGSVYFSQKKIHVTQSFSTETQFLMERLVQLVRTNTIDYDRFFVEVGPNGTDCATFDDKQTPESEGALDNTDENRADLGYGNIFFWDTNNDDILDRNLGGLMLDGNTDFCTQAWDKEDEQSTLYLINSSRTLRMAVHEGANSTIEIEQQLGADLDGDGIVDIWDDLGVWDSGNSICQIRDGGVGPFYDILGEHSQEFCLQAHEWTVVSPNNIAIENLSFSPAPNQDPFLSFALDDAQVHPHVIVFLETTLRNPENFGMTLSEIPNISLQTAASSRVFGNIRK